MKIEIENLSWENIMTLEALKAAIESVIKDKKKEVSIIIKNQKEYSEFKK